MPKRTDKERLDWVIENRYTLMPQVFGFQPHQRWWIVGDHHMNALARNQDARQAIDAAMAAQGWTPEKEKYAAQRRIVDGSPGL